MLMLTEEIETFLWKVFIIEKNQKKLSEVSKPLHLSTNPEILVKIAQALTPVYQSWNFGEDCSISVLSYGG